MAQHGIWNADHGLEAAGLGHAGTVYWNLTAPSLYRHALCRDEATLTARGALKADTGRHTGRSPKDKFIVRDDTTADTVWWDGTKPMPSRDCTPIFWIMPGIWTCSFRICMAGPIRATGCRCA